MQYLIVIGVGKSLVIGLDERCHGYNLIFQTVYNCYFHFLKCLYVNHVMNMAIFEMCKSIK